MVLTDVGAACRGGAQGYWLRFVEGVSGVPQGVIKKLTDRGFGFISADGGDIFFHHSSLVGATFEQLHEGQSVEYEVEEEGGGRRGGKGPRAGSVRPL